MVENYGRGSRGGMQDRISIPINIFLNSVQWPFPEHLLLATN